MQRAESEQATTAAVQEQQLASGSAEQLRMTGYSLLANLLHRPADSRMLQLLSELAIPDIPMDDMSMSWQLLKLAAQQNSLSAIDDEYHDLFVGLGHGEVIPYGSWYQTGYLMDKPLAKLRRDLVNLGIERNSDVKEPEDHIAALCETMALLINRNTNLQQQQAFYREHLANWAPRLFADIERAPSACFYQSVAHFGRHYLTLETLYLG